jgi:hypothetical protein
MIFGEYPCCDGILAISLDDVDKLPVFMKGKCPHCNEVVWHKLSKVDPTSWTESEFLLEFVVDTENKRVGRIDE